MSDARIAESPPEEERFRPGEGGPLIAYEHWHRYAIAARALPTGRVLDVASGEGYGARFLREIGFEVVVLDLERGCLNGMAPGTRARAEALPFANGAFDAVLCFETVEHVEDPRRVAAELARVTAPDGVLLLSTPDRDVYRDRMGQENPFHRSELTKNELVDLLSHSWPEIALFAQSIWAGSWMSRVDPDPSDAGTRVVPVSVRGVQAGMRRALTATKSVPRTDEPAAPWCSPDDERLPVPVYYLAVASRVRSRLTATLDRIGDASVLHDVHQGLIGDYLRAMAAVAVRDRHLDELGLHTRALEERHRRVLATLEQTIDNQRAAVAQREQQWRAGQLRIEALAGEIAALRQRRREDLDRSAEPALHVEDPGTRSAGSGAAWIRAWRRLRRAP